MKDKLRALLKVISDFNEQELDQIIDCFVPKSVKRNTILLHEGEVCNSFYFIATGCIRTYFIDKNGSEKTRYIMPDCSIGTALTSFISRQPSAEFLQTLEETELLAIHYTDFYRLNNQFRNWTIFYQKILEMAYTFQNKKIEQLVTLTAKQRYEKLLEENPKLIQIVSNKVLASYLDIREETLSRLKSGK